MVRQAGVEGEFEFGLFEADRFFLFERIDGPLEELAIEVEADG